MVRQPAVFLMDEPLSNLDASLRVAMRAQIRHLHTDMRTTFVYVTHDQAEALTLADRIVVMRDGIIQQLGTPHDIYERPRNMFVAGFLGSPAINFLDGELGSEAGVPCFRRGALTIALPASLARTASRDVVLGLRAEDVANPATGVATLTGVVDTAMPAGADQFLGLKVEGADVFVRIGKDARVNEGETVTLGINPGRLHLFDKATGQSLLHEASA
jgi:multiple sugar transport system ATP-binding protein